MHINVFADVSLRVVMLLAARDRGIGTQSQSGAERELTSRQIADAVGVPYNHVTKAVGRLRQMGVVRTERGRSGGVRLDVRGWSITVGALLRELDDDADPAACFRGDGRCPLLTDCVLRRALMEAREQYYRALDTYVVADLPRRSQMLPVMRICERGSSDSPSG